MKFHEKLNLLMNLQNIPNNKLAKALSVDPSLISRWRNGTRDLAKHSEYVTGISTYFANQTVCRESLVEILDIPKSDHIDTILLTDTIWHWLSDDLTTNTTLVNKFIDRFNQAKESKLPPFIPELLQNAPSGKKLSVEVYYGNEGKRQSAIKFLTTVITHKQTCTLKLYSDDSMDWMLEDVDFCIKWAHLIAEVIRRGNRILIIHTINRNTDEMNAAIDRWLPLYMTGAIEPYYYSGHQETPFKHTLFLAPEMVALKSSAMSGTTCSELLLYHDQGMLAALDVEFNAYLEHCRPLIKVFTMNEIGKFQTLLQEFEAQNGNMSILSKAPSLTTLPQATFTDVMTQLSNDSYEAQIEKQVIMSNYKNRLDVFNLNIQTCNQCEWLNLPEIDWLRDKTFSYSGPLDWFFIPRPTFEPVHYVQHVAHVLHLMKLHKNYNVHLTHLSIPDDIFIALKQGVGVIVCKVDQPPIFMALNHIAMINAFQNFIEEFSDSNCSDAHNKSVTIKIIENWLEQAKTVLEIS